MTEPEALARLQIMVAWDAEPALSPDEMGMLVDVARRADADGLAPSDTGWAPTWDLNAAAAEGWRWKAAKVANRYSVSTDGQSLSRSDLIAHCERMVSQYQRRVATSVPMRGAWTEA